MQFDSGDSKRAKHLAGNSVPFYRDPPPEAFLEDLEALAAERINVLLHFETWKQSGGEPAQSAKEFKDWMSKYAKHMDLSPEKTNPDRDAMSHWILRLAFSASDETRYRFVDFERELFKMRLAQTSVKTALKNDDLEYPEVPVSESNRLKDELLAVQSSHPAYRVAGPQPLHQVVKYYKVPFTDVLRLVSNRQVLLKGGIAYVPENQLVEAVASRFVEDLQKSMDITSRTLPFIMRDERVSQLLLKLRDLRLAVRHVGALSGSITKEQIPMLARRSFPMCARNLEGTLARHHHFKHFSRLQFTLFLKGIGLSIEDCSAYLKDHLLKSGAGADKWQKEYAYKVRHTYGLEGNRKNYPAWSCIKAINSEGQGVNDKLVAHGCPFANVRDKGRMERLLRDMGAVASDAQVALILHEFEQGKPQIACRVHWEALHPGGDSGAVGNHPNQWFDESVKYWKAKESGTEGPPAAAASGFVV